MQSFAYKVKSELCRTPVQKLCCARAEAYGVLLFCNTFTPREVRIITENPEFAARLPRLFHRAFSLKFDRIPEEDASHGKLIFQITDTNKLEKMISQFGFDARQSLALHVNFGMLEDDCCRMSFLRGAFLAGGSVTDPEKRYHLELATSHIQASREVSALLTEMGFLPRSVMRGANSVIYFKQSEHIEDLLTTIGAPVSAMDIMTAKVDKMIPARIDQIINRIIRQICRLDRENMSKNRIKAYRYTIKSKRKIRYILKKCLLVFTIFSYIPDKCAKNYIRTDKVEYICAKIYNPAVGNRYYHICRNRNKKHIKKQPHRLCNFFCAAI